MADRKESWPEGLCNEGIQLPQQPLHKSRLSLGSSSGASATPRNDKSPEGALRHPKSYASLASRFASPTNTLNTITSPDFLAMGSPVPSHYTNHAEVRTSSRQQQDSHVSLGSPRPLRARAAWTPLPIQSTGYRLPQDSITTESREYQEFLFTRNSMRRLFKNSDLAKWKFHEYSAHRSAMRAADRACLDKIMERMSLNQSFKRPQMTDKEIESMIALLPCTPNLTMVGNTGRVLGEKTVWCCDWMNGKDEISPWPSMPEMKWEGDDRAKTGVGRFPPLPREQGAHGMIWHQLEVIEQYPLDEIARIPTMEDVYLPVDQIEEGKVHDFINKDLEDAIDEYLAS